MKSTLDVSYNDQFISLAGGKVFARTWTPQGNTFSHDVPIVLFHDSLGCVASWREFPALLATMLQRRVIAYDRLGFGRSSARIALPSFDFIREEAEIFLPQICKNLDVGNFVALGHSVGGAMALLSAAHTPACHAVISVATQTFVEEKTKKGVMESKIAFAHPERLAKLRKYHGDKAEWVVRAWTEVWLDPQYASWSLKNDLPRVRCPVLVIHGDQDAYGSTAFPDMICHLATGPSQKHVLVGCGHVPHREREDEVSDLIAQFLAGLA